ncbi:MAG: nucleoside deaminase [Bacteroidota bacterium]
MDIHQQYMEMAGQLAEENVARGGGPFAALVVQNNEIIATGCNKVTEKHDPTAHAEIEAIRKATAQLGTYDLSGCAIYASCEPCPMCLGAIYWSRADALYFGNTRHDAAAIGFDDEFIYRELEKTVSERSIQTQQIQTANVKKAFEAWLQNPERKEY